MHIAHRVGTSSPKTNKSPTSNIAAADTDVLYHIAARTCPSSLLSRYLSTDLNVCVTWGEGLAAASRCRALSLLYACSDSKRKSMETSVKGS